MKKYFIKLFFRLIVIPISLFTLIIWFILMLLHSILWFINLDLNLENYAEYLITEWVPEKIWKKT